MRRETIAIHAGFDCDPDHQGGRVPIYQTVAYAFDSADHGAALFNLEEDGFRYSRISNPDQRGAGSSASPSWKAASRRVVAGLRPGGAALRLRHPGRPRRQHRRHAAALRHHPHAAAPRAARARASRRASPPATRPPTSSALIDDETRAVFCESVGNPAGNICDIEAIAAAAHRHGVPLIVDNTVATPILLRPDRVRRRHRRALADQVHGRPRRGDGRHRGRRRPLRLGAPTPRASRMFSEPDHSYHGLVYAERFGRSAFVGADAQRLSAHHRRGAGADERLPAAAGHRDGGAARRAARRERPQGGANSCAPIRASTG